MNNKQQSYKLALVQKVSSTHQRLHKNAAWLIITLPSWQYDTACSTEHRQLATLHPFTTVRC